jgi:hypothetical protein
LNGYVDGKGTFLYIFSRYFAFFKRVFYYFIRNLFSFYNNKLQTIKITYLMLLTINICISSLSVKIIIFSKVMWCYKFKLKYKSLFFPTFFFALFVFFSALPLKLYQIVKNKNKTNREILETILVTRLGVLIIIVFLFKIISNIFLLFFLLKQIISKLYIIGKRKLLENTSKVIL